MINIIPRGTKIDFLGKAPMWLTVSVVTFVLSLVILAVQGVNLGLDFSGGHQILVEFTKPISVEDTRAKLRSLFPDVDTSVQSFEVPDSPNTFQLLRIERSQSLGESDLEKLSTAFKGRYGEHFSRLRYNPEAGEVVEVEFAATASTAVGIDTSSVAIAALVTGGDHEVRTIRKIGRDDQKHFSVVLKSVDVTVVNAFRSLDPGVRAVRAEFVGPTVGKQLRDDGLLAVLYALVCILIYVALRFDIFYAPGAVICLFHDAVLTVAILSLLGEEFSLATIAGILTLVGYSINDTIVVFDRVREIVGKAQGATLKEVLNRAANETLGRTVLTGATTLIACICLMWFGRGTVLASFGLIMTVGVIIGTYSSLFVAAPIFYYLRERFGPRAVVPNKGSMQNTKPAATGV